MGRFDVAWPLVVGLEFVGGLLQRLSDQPDEPVDEEERRGRDHVDRGGG
ncbi:MAG: hypothetical protein R3B96_12945 [Pirellulaceae bacterium]